MAATTEDPDTLFAELQSVLHEMREAEDKLEEWKSIMPGDDIYNDIVSELKADQDVDVVIKEQQEAAVSACARHAHRPTRLSHHAFLPRRFLCGKRKSNASRRCRSTWLRC